MQESCNCEYQPDVLRNLALETNPKPCPFASVPPKGLQCSVAGLFCCNTTLCRRARTGMGTGFVAPASLFKRATAQRLRGPETVPNHSQQGLHTTMHSFRWLIEMLVPWFPHKNSGHVDFQTLAGIVCCVLTRPLFSTSSASLALQAPTCQWSLVGDTGWESQNQWPRWPQPSQPTNRNFHLFVWLTSEPRWQNHSEGYPRCRFHSLASWATSEFLAQHLDPRIPHCSHDTVCQQETPGQQRLWWAARVTQLLPIYMQFWGQDSSPVKRKPRVMLDMFRKVISCDILMMLRMLRWYPACFWMFWVLGKYDRNLQAGPTFSPCNLLGSPRWIRALGHQKGLAAWDGNVASAMCRSCCWMLLVDSIVMNCPPLKTLEGYLQMSRCRLLTLFAVYGSAETRTQRTSRRSVSSRQDPILTEQWQKKKN